MCYFNSFFLSIPVSGSTSILMSIILAFVFRRFLDNWMIIIKNGIKINILFTLWTILLFFGLIQHWFEFFSIHGEDEIHSTFEYLYYLLPLSFFYILSILIFPSCKSIYSSTISLKKHYLNVRSSSYICIIIYLVFTVINDTLHINNQYTYENNFFRVIELILIFIAYLYSKYDPNKVLIHYLTFIISIIILSYFFIFRNQNLIF